MNEQKCTLYRAYVWSMEIRDTRGSGFVIKPISIEKAKIKYIANKEGRVKSTLIGMVPQQASAVESFIEAHIRLARGSEDEMGNLEPLHQGLLEFSSFEILLCCYDGEGCIIDKMSYICTLKEANIELDYSSTEVMKLIAMFKIKTAANKEDGVVKGDHEFIAQKQEETCVPS